MLHVHVYHWMIVNGQEMEPASMPITNEWMKINVVHILSGLLSGNKVDKILPFAGKWKSKLRKQASHIFSHMWNLEGKKRREERSCLDSRRRQEWWTGSNPGSIPPSPVYSGAYPQFSLTGSFLPTILYHPHCILEAYSWKTLLSINRGFSHHGPHKTAVVCVLGTHGTF